MCWKIEENANVEAKVEKQHQIKSMKMLEKIMENLRKSLNC